MKHRNVHSHRFFSNDGHTPYHGADRRHAGPYRYFDRDRRRRLRDPAVQPPSIVRATPANSSASVAAFQPPPAAIGLRALELFRASGNIPGRDLDNWLEAEAQLRREAHQAEQETHHQAVDAWQRMLEESGCSHAEAQDERLWVSRLDAHGG